jgi:hypothetical protein
MSKTSNVGPDLVSLGEVRRRTGHTHATVMRRVLEGILPAIAVRDRSRQRFFVTRAALDRYVQTRGREQVPQADVVREPAGAAEQRSTLTPK